LRRIVAVAGCGGPDVCPGEEGAVMINGTLSDTVNELDRYLVTDDDEFLGPAQALPGATPIEIEMQVRLHDGTQVTIVEHVARMSELGGGLERARLRLATSLARGVIDGFDR
jgi:hypothetical protein